MSGSPTGRPSAATLGDGAFDALSYEILAEKAASLGRAAARAELCLGRLRDAAPEERDARLRMAADAVYAYFIQRELCGLRRHDDIIRDFRIPGAVLARLGAR